MKKYVNNAYLSTVDNLFDSLSSQETGLSNKEAKRRLEQVGYNDLQKSSALKSKAKIFFDQLSSALMVILIAAGVISGFLGEFVDATVILISAAFNVIVGYVQENKANSALSKLQSLVQYKAFVTRNQERQLIDSVNIVPGDILHLEAGDKIQADGRILDSSDFTVDESALTGESDPINKKETLLDDKDLGLGDRVNMVFRGTVVTAGKARVLVVATGDHTQIGQIAKLVGDTVDEKTPLQQQLTRMSRQIAKIAVGISLFVFFFGVLFSDEYTPVHMFETGVALAVAAIPEGLVITLTVILAIGMRFILAKNALVRKLVAAETLGSVNVICTDKTGTITEGKMKVTRLLTLDNELSYPELILLGNKDRKKKPDVFMSLRAGVLSNDAVIQKKDKATLYVGDTTDVALLKMGNELKMHKDVLEEAFPRLGEVSFTSERKFMASLNSVDQSTHIYVKGAPDVLYEKCTQVLSSEKEVNFTQKKREYFQKEQDKLTSEGLRVLAVCYKTTSKESISEEDVSGLTFVGLIAFSDPLRSDVKETLEIAHNAGIHTVMITGDHVKTAQSIAKQIGLPYTDADVFDGVKLSSISDEELRNAVKHVRIFARVDPVHKIRIVQAFQANGDVVAMTGDGVNDAPALKGADIGVALGSGTDVAKETADMVLLDDSFSTIVSSIEEGRVLYQNIRKVVVYLLSGSFAEVAVITTCILVGLPLAALPVQILWINIVENAFPNIALAFEKGEKNEMTEKPRKKSAPLIDHEMRTMILTKSIVANILLFSIFIYIWKTTNDIELTRSVMFVGFGIDALFYIFSVRSLKRMIWHINPLRNVYVLLAVAFGWLMLLSAIYWSPLQRLLSTVPIAPKYWVMMIVFGLTNIVVLEIVKAIYITKQKKQSYA